MNGRTMYADVDSLRRDLPRIREAAAARREILLGHLAIVGEIPSPAGAEEARVRMLVERMSENPSVQCSIDELGSGYALLPGAEGGRTIVVATNADTLADEHFDPEITVNHGEVTGPFVGDNSLAMAALATLPDLLDRLGARLRSNLVMMAAARVLGRHNLSGLGRYLDAGPAPVCGLCVESVQLGRLNYSSLGMLQCEVTVTLPDDYDWVRFGAAGSILPMNDVVGRIGGIPLPRRPITSIVLGFIRGGLSHRSIARETCLGFEVRSESAEILQQIEQQMEDICEDVAAASGVRVTLDVFARRVPGGIDIAHPLVREARATLAALGVAPMLYPSTGMLSAFTTRRIPAITVGLTSGGRRGDLEEIEETVQVDPIWTGLAQLAGLVLAVDGGFCHVA